MDSSAVTPRHVLQRMPTYVAGKPPEDVEGLTSYKLSSNENPYAPVPEALEAVVAAARAAVTQRYPETTYAGVREVLAKTHQVPAENITVGAGSLGVLTALVQTYVGVDTDGTEGEVIIPWRSFEAYPIVIRTAGAQDVMVPLLSNGEIDMAAMLAAITERTKMIVICTPNNPTGAIVTTKAMRAFLNEVPPNILVVIDEAYIEFIRRNDAVDGVDMYREYPNVVVLRTFSKAHGLANMRIGYSIAHQDITKHVKVIQSTFATSTLAEEAAKASLANLEQVLAGTDKVVVERERVWQKLDELGYQPPATQANFVWLPLGELSQPFADACGEQALSVRAFHPEGVRVTVGEVEANDRVIKVATEFAKKHGI